VHPDGYFALVLTPASSARVEAALATLSNPIAHHCTVCHGTADPAHLPPIFSAADIGRSFQLHVVGFAAGPGVEAVVVTLILPDGTRVERGFTQNAVPHVTLATDGEAEPFTANALLEEGFAAVDDGPVLTATLLHSHAWTNP